MAEEFLVTWAKPEHARMAWRRDRWHAPDPITTLAVDSLALVQNGFQRGFRATGAPVAMAFHVMNGYVYMGVGPADPAGLQPLGKEPQPIRLENHAAWDNIWLPEIQSYHARWEAFDRENASDTELAAHIEESLPWAERCWEIHARLDFSTEGLLAFAQAELGWDAAKTQRMLAGLPNKSLESDERLRRLAAIVRDSKELTAAFLDRLADSVLDALSEGSEAKAFRAELASFLNEFGMRYENEIDSSSPSWIDDPAPVLAIIRAYVSQPPRDHEAMRSRLAEVREQTIAEARQLLAGRGAEFLQSFERELSLAQRASELNETHNHWIDQQVTYWTQQNFMAAGRRFARQGIIESPGDVAHLTLPEILEGLRGNSASRRSDVEDRKRDLDRYRKMQAPLELGSSLPPEVSGGLDTVFGGHRTSTVAAEVHGQAASPGTVTGTARIILSLKDSDRIEEGDILVTKTTSPPWTPLFGIVSAVVTDAGGALSHCAIVAREYAIPAVVGCVDATQRIADGARIRVDGDTGIVTLL